ncbi:aromatic-ring-hydroxylating dioxygenase subunit beta [Bacillus sp. EB600]|uniref:aromatic-ring-hydroxylating dioxygenase subunit beta n=1 Tax=Bacillus sp. EB600 TaxID=2806345 RepID=UPI002736D75E|nr:aromatic-ring-hydroxylating dioxygenase subunit beta [Bacillus sp. EB600]
MSYDLGLKQGEIKGMEIMELVKPFKWAESRASLELQHEIEQFYYKEAQLLDHSEFEAWFELMDKDIHYWMPIRMNRVGREMSQEYAPLGKGGHYDDTYETMRGRIRARVSGVNWAENPVSRTRHIISNVIIREMEEPNTYEVASSFIVYRNRSEHQADIFPGERRDVLRRSEGGLGFKIARRTILIDQSTLLSNNLSVFF